MIVAIIPVLVFVVGLLIWALASQPLVKDVGRIMFAAGLLVALFVVATKAVHIP